ncbi:MAG: hypothetical protein IT444_02195 [Phycisphaeraceae bacterium]|nr:hypothetical protein [Phycisphaeraceae bacterium]
MGWMLSIVVALVTGIVALLSAGLVASLYANWYRVTNFEGTSGFMVVGVALLGGIAGTIVGLLIARILAGAGFWKAAGGAIGFVLIVAALTTLMFYLFADLPPTLGNDQLILEVEIKLPAGQPLPEGSTKFTLGSVINNRQRASCSGTMNLKKARLEDNRWIVPAEVDLFTTRGRRMILAEVEGNRLAAFIVPLPAKPTSSYEQWSDWEPRPRPGNPPWPDSNPSYRFRIQRISSRPAETDSEESLENQVDEEDHTNTAQEEQH